MTNFDGVWGLYWLFTFEGLEHGLTLLVATIGHGQHHHARTVLAHPQILQKVVALGHPDKV